MLLFLRNLPVWFYLSFYISLYLLFVSLTAYCICILSSCFFPFFLPNRLTFFLFRHVGQPFRLYVLLYFSLSMSVACLLFYLFAFLTICHCVCFFPDFLLAFSQIPCLPRCLFFFLSNVCLPGIIHGKDTEFSRQSRIL